MPCECRGCRALYRVICRGGGEPFEAVFCIKCGSNLDECHPESAAWRNHIERKALASEGVIRPPATERAPVLDTLRGRGETPRCTESGQAPGWQGATREHIGHIRPRSNAVSRDAWPLECSGAFVESTTGAVAVGGRG